MADLTTLYQGIFDSPWNPTPKSFEGNIGQGRWYTSDPTTARSYAKGLTTGTGTPKLGGSVYSMDVDPSKALSKSSTFAEKLGKRGYEHLAEFGKKPNVYLATKELIKEGAPKINWGQTALTNLEALGSRGLGFLKNNAFRTLAMLGSLPAQVGIMALTPTSMGDVSDFESPENQRLISLQNQVTSQANREARERVGRGEARDYGHTQTRSSSGWRSDPMWKGGIVNLYRYGGFI